MFAVPSEEARLHSIVRPPLENSVRLVSTSAPPGEYFRANCAEDILFFGSGKNVRWKKRTSRVKYSVLENFSWVLDFNSLIPTSGLKYF